MEFIIGLLTVGIFLLTLGFLVGWIYLRNSRKYLVITVPMASNGYTDPNDSDFRQKLRKSLKMWKTGLYYKIIIISPDHEVPEILDEDERFCSPAAAIYVSLLSQAVPMDKIEIYYECYDPPGHVIQWDTVFVDPLKDSGSVTPALAVGEINLAETSSPALTAVED